MPACSGTGLCLLLSIRRMECHEFLWWSWFLNDDASFKWLPWRRGLRSLLHAQHGAKWFQAFSLGRLKRGCPIEWSHRGISIWHFLMSSTHYFFFKKQRRDWFFKFEAPGVRTQPIGSNSNQHIVILGIHEKCLERTSGKCLIEGNVSTYGT